MGDIADMILEGLLDEETGEYIGNINESIYGTSAPGFPVSHERDNRQGQNYKELTGNYSCPLCRKNCKKTGLFAHITDQHPEMANRAYKQLTAFMAKESENQQ